MACVLFFFFLHCQCSYMLVFFPAKDINILVWFQILSWKCILSFWLLRCKELLINVRTQGLRAKQSEIMFLFLFLLPMEATKIRPVNLLTWTFNVLTWWFTCIFIFLFLGFYHWNYCTTNYLVCSQFLVKTPGLKLKIELDFDSILHKLC